jgi:hypothetical protein
MHIVITCIAVQVNVNANHKKEKIIKMLNQLSASYNYTDPHKFADLNHQIQAAAAA